MKSGRSSLFELASSAENHPEVSPPVHISALRTSFLMDGGGTPTQCRGCYGSNCTGLQAVYRRRAESLNPSRTSIQQGWSSGGQASRQEGRLAGRERLERALKSGRSTLFEPASSAENHPEVSPPVHISALRTSFLMDGGGTPAHCRGCCGSNCRELRAVYRLRAKSLSPSRTPMQQGWSRGGQASRQQDRLTGRERLEQALKSGRSTLFEPASSAENHPEVSPPVHISALRTSFLMDGGGTPAQCRGCYGSDDTESQAIFFL